MKTKCLISLLSLLLIITVKQGYSQVTIGSEMEPGKGALLDLKEKIPENPDLDNSDSEKGFNLPRVNLVDKNNLFPMFESDGSGGYKKGSQTYNKKDEDKSHTGLMVYNVSTTFPQGMYCWDGKQWNIVAEIVTGSPAITALVCETYVDGSQKFVDGDTNFTSQVRVSYTGGNGAVYFEGPVIDCMTGNGLVTGLKAQLQEGKLANGSGELIYKIWADPAVSGNSPSLAKFPITFKDKSGNDLSCVITLGNATPIAQTESYASIGPLVPTIDEEHRADIARGYYVPGFERVITTPDGRWSMRAFIGRRKNYADYGGLGTPDASMCTLNEVDISIRANDMNGQDRNIMWAANVVFQGGDFSATQVLYIPAAASDRWGGNQRGVGNLDRRGGTEFFGLYPSANTIHNGMNVGWQVALGNPNVFDGGSPENRVYTFTEIGDGTSPPYLPRTVYTITFMMGSAGDLDRELDEARAALTTVYFKVEQSMAVE